MYFKKKVIQTNLCNILFCLQSTYNFQSIYSINLNFVIIDNRRIFHKLNFLSFLC